MNNLTNEEIEIVKNALTSFVENSTKWVNKKETTSALNERISRENTITEIVKKI